LIKTERTERFTTALGAEPQGYRHVLNIIYCKPATVGTTALPV